VIELCDRVARVFEFALMGQRSELVALELHDLAETPDGLEVLIHASKTDQDVHGAVVAIPARPARRHRLRAAGARCVRRRHRPSLAPLPAELSRLQSESD